MAFLTLNGWTIPVRDGQARGSRTPFGDSGPSWTNRPNRQRRGLPRSWSLTTIKLSGPDAETLEALIEGRGYHFPFDENLSSTNGLVPQGGAGTISFPGKVASPPVVGRSHLQITSGSVVWNPGVYDGKWTVMFWRDVTGTPEHVVVRGDGAKWIDGVRNDAATTTELTVSNGAVSLSVGEYDDLVILPFNASSSYVESVYAFVSSGPLAYPDCPSLILNGDVVGSGFANVEVIGSHGDTGYLQHGSSTGWVNNAREVSFTLEEKRSTEPKVIALDETYLLSLTYATAGGDVFPVNGAENRASTPGAGVSVGAASGPHGLIGASTFNGGATANIPILDEMATALIGSSVFSCVAWVRRATVSAATLSILNIACGSTSEAKANLYIAASANMTIAGRSETGEILRSATGAAIADTEWHMVGGVLDLARGSISVCVDGDVAEQSIAWNASTFDETVTAGGNFIGALGTGATGNFNGDVAVVGWTTRRLTPADFRAIYRRGLNGWAR